jgi:hypothetical protein
MLGCSLWVVVVVVEPLEVDNGLRRCRAGARMGEV